MREGWTTWEGFDYSRERLEKLRRGLNIAAGERPYGVLSAHCMAVPPYIVVRYMTPQRTYLASEAGWLRCVGGWPSLPCGVRVRVFR